MKQTWQHPQLGTFTFTDGCWNGRCRLPAFKSFTAQDQKANGRNFHRISPKTLTYFLDGEPVEEHRILKCRCQGNRVTFDVCSKRGFQQTWEYWCDGKILVSDNGLVYRRAT